MLTTNRGQVLNSSRLNLVCLFFLLVFSAVAGASPTRQAINYQLQGDFDAAYRYGQQLLAEDPVALTHIATQLNTLIVENTWDPSDRTLDAEIERLARSLLRLCQSRSGAALQDPRLMHYCGMANFSLSYLFAAQGKLIASARRASLAVNELERSIEISGQVCDAGLHLGVLYYYTDNLPGFVRAVGRVLWFIPTGDGDKALPYIKQAVECGGEYSEGARFILADILAQGSETEQAEAVQLLEGLIDDYPANARLYYNLLESLDSLGRFEDVLKAHELAVQSTDLAEPHMRLSLDVWKARALGELGRLELAMLALQAADTQAMPQWLLDLVAESKLMIDSRRRLALN